MTIEQVGMDIGCNFSGRLEYIQEQAMDGNYRRVRTELLGLLKFFPKDVTNREQTEEPIRMSKRVNISDSRGSDGRFI